MEELLELKGNAPEFQLRADSCACRHFDPSRGESVLYTPEERAGFVDELTEKTQRIFELGQSVSRAFVEIGYLLLEIKKKNLIRFACIKSQTFIGIDDFAFKVFGFQKSTTYNLMRIVEEFGDREGGLSEDYRGYSQTQLVCLLSFSYSERKMFTPVATVAEIKELRAGLKKYPLGCVQFSDFGKKITWRTELERVRKAAAEEAVAEKKGKKEERTQGLLSMLALAETGDAVIYSPSPKTEAADAPVVALAETIPEAPKGKKLGLKNREERKKWVETVFDGATPFMTIPELDLKIYRYEFVNGARLFRLDGVTYWEAWSTEPGREDRVSKYFITDSKFPKFDLLRGKSVNQVVDWLTEQGKEI